MSWLDLEVTSRSSCESSCTGKVDYKSAETACKAARRMSGRARTGKLEAYRCTYCQGWHIGHALWRPVDALRRAAKKVLLNAGL